MKLNIEIKTWLILAGFFYGINTKKNLFKYYLISKLDFSGNSFN